MAKGSVCCVLLGQKISTVLWEKSDAHPGTRDRDVTSAIISYKQII